MRTYVLGMMCTVIAGDYKPASADRIALSRRNGDWREGQEV